MVNDHIRRRLVETQGDRPNCLVGERCFMKCNSRVTTSFVTQSSTMHVKCGWHNIGEGSARFQTPTDTTSK
eukprot:1724111-Amphidinium_carterae.1